MRPDFDRAFDVVVSVEGELSLDPMDRGNWTSGEVGVGILRGTKYGISAAAFPVLDIASLTLAQAKEIYRTSYWEPVGGDVLPGPVALVVFDGAVSQGVRTSAMLLQAAVGATQDGIVGPRTVASVATSGGGVVQDVCARRAVHYAQGDMARYGLGWMRRLLKIYNTAEGMRSKVNRPLVGGSAARSIRERRRARKAAEMDVKNDIDLMARGLTAAVAAVLESKELPQNVANQAQAAVSDIRAHAFDVAHSASPDLSKVQRVCAGVQGLMILLKPFLPALGVWGTVIEAAGVMVPVVLNAIGGHVMGEIPQPPMDPTQARQVLSVHGQGVD